MTQTLKEQLTTLVIVSLCGGAFLWNSGAVRAQPTEPIPNRFSRPKLTREEAARGFLDLLESYAIMFERGPYSSRSWSPDSMMMGSYSRKSTKENLSAFLVDMSKQFKQPRKTFKVQSESDKTAILLAEAPAVLLSRQLVLIKEDDYWGVDVVETWAKWNGLEGQAKIEAIARFNEKNSYWRDRERRSSCQENLKAIALGLDQYANDHDRKFPPAQKWSEALKPYLEAGNVLDCPELPKGQRFGYAFNSKFSSKIRDSFKNSDRIIFFYETSILKRNAFGTGEDLAFRHQNGANYAFADGHVKWFPKTTIPSFKLKP